MSKLPDDFKRGLDDKIKRGYGIEDEQGAADAWLEAWEMVKAGMDEYGIKNIEEFDRELKDISVLCNSRPTHPA
ncbi:MAG: hypothetical protein KGZ94_05020 [Clostridia bacterium]|nr:hypothetical protein [Clostridia bacterium]